MTNLYEEAKSHFNEPVLIDLTVGRIIGYAETEEDCYLLVNTKTMGVVWQSYVGGYIYLDCLKGINPVKSSYDYLLDDYEYLNYILNCHGILREPEFLYLDKEASAHYLNKIWGMAVSI